MVFNTTSMGDTFEKAWGIVKGSPVPLFAQDPGRYRNTLRNTRMAGRGRRMNESDGEFMERRLSVPETTGLRGMANRKISEERREALDELGERPFLGGKKYDRKLDRIRAKRAPTDFRAERMTHGTDTGSHRAENPMEDEKNPFE